MLLKVSHGETKYKVNYWDYLRVLHTLCVVLQGPPTTNILIFVKHNVQFIDIILLLLFVVWCCLPRLWLQPFFSVNQGHGFDCSLISLPIRAKAVIAAYVSANQDPGWECSLISLPIRTQAVIAARHRIFQKVYTDNVFKDQILPKNA